MEDPEGLGDGLNGAAKEAVVEVKASPVERGSGRSVSRLHELLGQRLYGKGEQERAKGVALLDTLGRIQVTALEEQARRVTITPCSPASETRKVFPNFPKSRSPVESV